MIYKIECFLHCKKSWCQVIRVKERTSSWTYRMIKNTIQKSSKCAVRASRFQLTRSMSVFFTTFWVLSSSGLSSIYARHQNVRKGPYLQQPQFMQVLYRICYRHANGIRSIIWTYCKLNYNLYKLFWGPFTENPVVKHSCPITKSSFSHNGIQCAKWHLNCSRKSSNEYRSSCCFGGGGIGTGAWLQRKKLRIILGPMQPRLLRSISVYTVPTPVTYSTDFNAA